MILNLSLNTSETLELRFFDVSAVKLKINYQHETETSDSTFEFEMPFT